MNDPTPARPATHSPDQASEAPAGVLTDQGAREGLVEQLAEAMRPAIASVYDRHDRTRPLNHVNHVEWIEAVAPVVAALRERVTRVEALRDEWRAHVAAQDGTYMDDWDPVATLAELDAALSDPTTPPDQEEGAQHETSVHIYSPGDDEWAVSCTTCTPEPRRWLDVGLTHDEALALAQSHEESQ